MATGNQFIKTPNKPKLGPFGISPPFTFDFKQPTCQTLSLKNNQPDNRPSYSHMFMETCVLWRKRSTCQRIQTASVIVKNNNIISIGYNGVPCNQKHCTTFWKQFFNCAKGQNQQVDTDINSFYQFIVKEFGFNVELMRAFQTYEEFIVSDLFSQLHHSWSDKYELHAELNALLQAETNTHGATLYTLYSPCRQCAKSIISAKIVKVVYYEKYLRDIEALELLQRSGIIIEKIQ